MKNWYKLRAFFLVLISFFLSRSDDTGALRNKNASNLNYNPLLENTDSEEYSKLLTQFDNKTWLYDRNSVQGEMQLISLSNSSRLANNNIGEILKVDNWLARQQNSCKNINSAYQEIYSFETDNYYISICQLADRFYYHRQSKFDNDSILLIPARTISHGGIFQATSRGTTYFVGRDGDRYYSSVMQNDNEIVFEPELQLSSDSVLARDIAEANSQLSIDGVRVERATNASLELDLPENSLDSQQALICTGADTSTSHLHSWQQLLGESLDTASKYASNKGYSFIYDAQTPEQALITTQVAIVDLNIAPTSGTIERVCIRPLAEN